MTIPIGLQLYTVRDVLKNGLEEGLARVAAIGYKNVELAGLYGKTPAEARKICDKLGLKITSAHVPVDQLRDNMAGAIADAKVLGYDLIVCPYLGDNFRTLKGYREAAAILNNAGKQAADAGMELGYHNHSFEFQMLEQGQRGMDILFGQTDPKLVGSELDVYWVQHGNEDPVAYMRKLAGRVPVLHIKDMEKGPNRGFAEVGTGVLNFKEIVAAAPSVGVRYYVIEQDGGWIDGDPMKSAKLSFDNFSKIAK
ncbi:MAG: sugar phosphate isomerase/epimerase [Phycisphaeraceae bacterium]